MNKRVLIATGVAAALAIQAALALYFLSRDDADADVAAADNEAKAGSNRVLYHNLRPPFVVTLPYGNRQFMLQADLAVMASEPAAIDAVIRHAPLIRAEVIGYLTDLDPEQVRSRDGKDAMLEGLTELINGALRSESEGVNIESVLFNNLVMQ
jgi:flagellar basal body-associated protein FliL